MKKKNKSLFELKPLKQNTSPLDVKGVNTGITKDEIISVLREIRERS